jgi:hypothetical protein
MKMDGDLARCKTKIVQTGQALEKARGKGGADLSGKLEQKLSRRMSSEERLEAENDFSLFVGASVSPPTFAMPS